jgi:hypothetical protein
MSARFCVRGPKLPLHDESRPPHIADILRDGDRRLLARRARPIGSVGSLETIADSDLTTGPRLHELERGEPSNPRKIALVVRYENATGFAA